MILSVCGKNHGSLEGLEMKNGGEKSRTPVYRGWDAAPPIAPKDNLSLQGLGVPLQSECPNLDSEFGAWYPTSLRALRTPVHPFFPHLFELVSKCCTYIS